MAPPSDINTFVFQLPSEVNVEELKHFQQYLEDDHPNGETKNYLLRDLVCFLEYISERDKKNKVIMRWSKQLTKDNAFMYGPVTWLNWFQNFSFQEQQILIQRLWELIENKALTIQEKEKDLVQTLYETSFPRSTKLTRLETEVLSLALKKQNVSASELAKVMQKSTQLLSRTLKRLLEKNYMAMSLEPIYPKFDLQTYAFIISHDENVQPDKHAWGIHEDWLISHYQAMDKQHDILQVALPRSKEVTFQIMKWINQLEAHPGISQITEMETNLFGKESKITMIPHAFRKIEEWEKQKQEDESIIIRETLSLADHVSFETELKDPMVQKGVKLILSEGFLPIRIIEQRLNLSYRNAKSLRSFILDKFVFMNIIPGTNYNTSLYYLLAEADKSEHKELVNFLAKTVPFQRAYTGKGQWFYSINQFYYVSNKQKELLELIESMFDFRMNLFEIPIPPYPLKRKNIPFNRLTRDFKWDIENPSTLFLSNIKLINKE